MSRRGAATAERIVSFPHMGNYWIPLRPMAELLGGEIRLAPPTTKRTLELGVKYSPEFVCVPFKYTLGNYIEALENGATTLIQAGGGCRLGYYGEVQDAILRDLGYEFEFVSLSPHSTSVPKIIREFKRLNPHNSYRTVLAAFDLAWKKAEALEQIEDFVRRNVGFQTSPGRMEAVQDAFLRALDAAPDIPAVTEVRDGYAEELALIAVHKPEGLLRVGVVGEVYVAMEPFSNHFVEKQLAERGVEVHRHVSIIAVMENVYDGPNHVRKLLENARPYLRNNIGTDGTNSVAVAQQLMKEGFDGIVHVKPFGCMPEVNAVAPLQRLSRENLFPVLFLSFDSQSSETGVRTRIEAFCDMLSLRKGARCG